jgi:hypothetical protein
MEAVGYLSWLESTRTLYPAVVLTGSFGHVGIDFSSFDDVIVQLGTEISPFGRLSVKLSEYLSSVPTPSRRTYDISREWCS